MGSALLVAGVALFCGCTWDFARRGRGTGNPHDPPIALVVKGPYRFSRNPMYVAVLAIVFGEAALFSSWALFVYGVLAAIGFHLRVLIHEEPNLRRLFGEDYDTYRSRVPRWIG